MFTSLPLDASQSIQYLSSLVDSASMTQLGVSMFESDIDDVVFSTNEFLTDATFIGPAGPFYYILQMCMCLAALFSICLAAGMAFKMFTKGETFDVLKILRCLAIALVMTFWYPTSLTGLGGGSLDVSILDMIAYIPNCIGSYTADLYNAEAQNVNDKLGELMPKIKVRNDSIKSIQAQVSVLVANDMKDDAVAQAIKANDINSLPTAAKEHQEQLSTANYAGLVCMFDQLIMFLSLLLYRVGWWGTIYCQQIVLGMLTIFGPIQWAFSLLPKWEGAWSKWIIRYLTVHFYGAMLYFVGFYILLLFDIVLSVQIEELASIETDIQGFMKNAVLTGGYLLVASIVSLKCLNLVPDLAAWMIPEGDTAFSTRNFGEGVASSTRSSVSAVAGKVL